MKDIDALVSYISAVTDLDHLNEVMELLKHSLEVPGDDHGKLYSRLSGALTFQAFVYVFMSVSDLQKTS